MNWVNDKLASGKNSTGLKVERLNTDLSNGVLLLRLLENLTGANMAKYNAAPRVAAQSLVNLDIAFQFLRKEGVKLVSIGECSAIHGSNLEMLVNDACLSCTCFREPKCIPRRLDPDNGLDMDSDTKVPAQNKR